MQNPIISINKISKAYFEKKLFDNLSLDIFPRDFIAICGESGVGKSTLFNIIAGFETADSGNIFFENKQINYRKANQYRNSNLGFIFQAYNLLNKRTVQDNIKLPLQYSEEYRMDDTLYKKLINDLNLSSLENSISDDLSGGEKQRVAIARAMIMNPKIILADEPTGNLDYANAINIIHILKEINNDYNTAIVLITHDKEIAKNAKIIYNMDKRGLTKC